jgi:23S rRNA (uridine2552-2'-O)-methyltransferase
MKRSKSSKNWMHEHVNDEYVRRARKEGYRSRAAYKLIEIDARDRLLRPGMVIVDLGAAPGGWSQVAREKIGPKGMVLALDLIDMTPLRGVTFIRGDFRSQEGISALEQSLEGRKVDLVLSDMSPNISGVNMSDQMRAMELAELSLEFSRTQLKPGGHLLVKVFQGHGFQEFFRQLRGEFRSVSTRKPAASRDRSKELYLLGRGRIARFARDTVSPSDSMLDPSDDKKGLELSKIAQSTTRS